MFKITQSKGFQVKFPNGVTLSTQWGTPNYCQNYRKELTGDIESSNCEIAIWDENNDWITDKILLIDGDVEGYVSVEDWVKIVNLCANY